MIPSAVVALEALPLTPNGKIDRQALPAPSRERSAGRTPPRTALEQVVAAVWEDVLEVSEVAADDDFFELGGHSLLATQVVSRLRDALQVQVPLRSLFAAPTVAGLIDHWLTDPAERQRAERSAELVLEVQGMSEEQVEALLADPGRGGPS